MSQRLNPFSLFEILGKDLLEFSKNPLDIFKMTQLSSIVIPLLLIIRFMPKFDIGQCKKVGDKYVPVRGLPTFFLLALFGGTFVYLYYKENEKKCTEESGDSFDHPSFVLNFVKIMSMTTLLYLLLTKLVTTPLSKQILKSDDNIILRLINGFVLYLSWNLSRNYMTIVGRNKCIKKVLVSKEPEVQDLQLERELQEILGETPVQTQPVEEQPVLSTQELPEEQLPEVEAFSNVENYYTL